eukprot:5036875-Alexandrium_andersonii.AAC.1
MREGRMPKSKHWTPDPPVAHNLPAPAHPNPLCTLRSNRAPGRGRDERKQGVRHGEEGASGERQEEGQGGTA